MVGYHYLVESTFEVSAPPFEAVDDRQQLLVAGAVIGFCGSELPGMEGNSVRPLGGAIAVLL